MPTIPFVKYQATGNDFILIDNRSGTWEIPVDSIPKLCDRKFGIGSDGLMLIQAHPNHDFELIFYNPDASQSLCGNGSRCAVQFANALGMTGNDCTFLAFDGMHEATISIDGNVRLKMQNVQNVMQGEHGMLVDTGSPHLIRFVQDIDAVDVSGRGREIRFNDTFREKGVNVNFVEIAGEQSIFVRTYERGVENETLSCGTGVTAAALACGIKDMQSPVNIETKGGKLTVEFSADENGGFRDVFLSGPAKFVFSGEIELDKL